jgi:hypothetical protein
MPFSGRRFSHDDNHQVLTAAHLWKPAAEQASRAHPKATSHLVWICQCDAESSLMLRQQIRVSLGDVRSTLGRQFNFTTEIRTSKSRHYVPFGQLFPQTKAIVPHFWTFNEATIASEEIQARCESPSPELSHAATLDVPGSRLHDPSDDVDNDNPVT